MNEIVKFEDERGQAVQVTAQDVQRLICPNATMQEVAFFLELCRVQRLNPWTKEVYLVKYGNQPASIIVGKDVFTKRAYRNPECEGWETGVVIVTKKGVERREGTAYYPEVGEKLLGGWARVFTKGKRPTYAEVSLAEYSTGKALWASKPAVMVAKVATVTALRNAYPEAYAQLYSSEEMGEAGEMVAQGINAPQNAPQRPTEAPAPIEVETVEAVELMTEAQGAMLQELCEKFGGMRGKAPSEVYAALMGCRAMQEAGAAFDEVMTTQQADTAAAVLMGWIEKAQAMQQPVEPEPVEVVEAEPIQW